MTPELEAELRREAVSASLALIDQVVAEHNPSHVFALFSGGHDSLVNTFITAQHPRFSGVVHCNTGIGIEETREFVRDTCRAEVWPLIERFPPRVQYDQICLERGMPGGPKKHEIVYHRLKGEAIDQIVAETKTHWRDRIILSTGIRKQESTRRMLLHAFATRRDGAKVFVNPISDWSALDVSRAVDAWGLKRNPVVDKLHRSGECLCGALARPQEIEEIAFWYPDVARRIHALEQQCHERGLPSRWGSTEVLALDARQQWLPLCQSCETRWEAMA